ncbi:hypothetical protein PR202_gb19586 [Eleusine coracana subsp. coracana]|uniref:F-box associated domain-containing protein n=1 Tax=Eleusine coracana subsp. coracana TaxID=191504 RepID=A0AAV5F8G3_ELECO|nr:hypothetical protein PR202_gb19586 [Eleusine coracana subsp. coracana]
MPRLTVHASLDGLLVVSFLHTWYVCNPATRQWAPLPDLSYCDVVGFYEHVSSREYRVMYQIGKDDEHVSTYYYVLTVGTRLSRIIGCPISPEADEDMGLDIGLDPARFSPPVQLRRNLHWPPQESAKDTTYWCSIQSPSCFHWMSPPVRDKDMRLLEIEGKLALSVSRMNKATLELWRLEDYQNEIWVQMFRIQLAVAQMTELHREDWYPAVVSPEGDVLIECPYRVLHCDRNGNLLQKFRLPDEAASARHALRESLLQHAIFLAPKWHGTAVRPNPTITQAATTEGDTPRVTVNPEFNHWYHQDQLVLTTILSSVTEEVLGQTVSLTTARDVWRHREKMYASTSKAQIMQIRMQLAMIQKGDLSIAAYFNKVKGLTDILASVGKKLEDEELIAYMLCGLGSEYDPLVTSIMTRVDTINPGDLYAHMITFDTRIEHNTTNHQMQAPRLMQLKQKWRQNQMQFKMNKQCKLKSKQMKLNLFNIKYRPNSETI